MNSPGHVPETFTLTPSLFGSPFAYISYQDRHDFFKGLLCDNTRMLFDQVVAEATSLRQRLSSFSALTNDGHSVRFCALTESEPPSPDCDSSEESNSDESKLYIYRFGPEVQELRLPMSANPTSAAPRLLILQGMMMPRPVNRAHPSIANPPENRRHSLLAVSRMTKPAKIITSSWKDI